MVRTQETTAHDAALQEQIMASVAGEMTRLQTEVERLKAEVQRVNEKMRVAEQDA